MAANTWLCTPNKNDKIKNFYKKYSKKHNKKITNKISNNINTRNLAFLLILVLSIQVLHTTVATTATANSQSAAAAAATETTQNQNTLLSDEIEHEELIGANSNSNQPHLRRKRLIWITDDGRLALPPGTSLTFTPTIALPLVRHPPEGFFSNMSISFPVTIDFDKLGLTDNQNPLGDLPPLFARSFGHAAGNMLGNYVARYLHYKRKRDLNDASNAPKVSASKASNSGFHIKNEPVEQMAHSPGELPELPERFKHIFHGGERAMLYVVVEDFLSNFGMDGKACLLRLICEIHSRSLDHFGVFGEMAKLFLTVTKSPFADLIPEYVQAQEIGEGRQAPGECFPYYKECPKSIFKAIENHKYSRKENSEYNEATAEEVNTFEPLKEENLESVDINFNEISNNDDQFLQQSFSM